MEEGMTGLGNRDDEGYSI